MIALLKKASKLFGSLFNSSDKEENSSKKIITSIVILLTSNILIPVLVFSIPGILLKSAWDTISGAVSSFFGFNTETELRNYSGYIHIRNSYLQYLDKINVKISDRVEELKREYTYIKTITYQIQDEEGEWKLVTEVITVVPEVIKTIKMDKPEFRHLMAYIGVKYVDIQDSKFNLDINEGIEFFESISDYQEQVTGTDPVYYTVTTKVKELEEIAKMYFPLEIEQEQFKFSFLSMEDQADIICQEAYDFVDISTINIHEQGIKVPHFLMYDESYANQSYRGGVLANKGAAPTCISMILSYYENKVIFPDALLPEMDSYTYEWNMFADLTSKYDIQCRNVGKNQVSIIKALEEGNPVIAYLHPGELSEYVVIRGITADGKLLINDPNDVYSEKDYYKKLFNFSEIYNKSYTFFIFKG